MNNTFSDRQIEIMQAATKRIDSFGIQELTIKKLAADLNLSEAALYRHFESKNKILLGLINYFMLDMKSRIGEILIQESKTSGELLRQLFASQLNNFVKNPAICSVIFSEGIFQFNKDLSNQLSKMMDLMQQNIEDLIEKGQNKGEFGTLLSKEAITTIIMGSMRMVVLKWKLSGNKSNLVKDGTLVLNGLLKMIEK